MGWKEEDGVQDWSLDKISEISQADVAFPARGLTWLPDCKSMGFDTVGEACSVWMNNAWARYISRLFFDGGALPTEEDSKEGVSKDDAAKALLIVRASLGSFAPSHEHKTSACAWILDKYFNGPPEKEGH